MMIMLVMICNTFTVH